jgi:hypothetical protein
MDASDHIIDIDEGEELRLPLKYESDVTPRIVSSFGRIEKGAFVWKADCHHGDEPLHVSIQGESKTRIGSPLNFDSRVHHCYPKFVIQADGDLHDTSQLVIPQGQTRTITVSNTRGDLSQYIYDSHLEAETPNIRLTEEISNIWKLTLQCLDDDSENTLWIHAQPSDDDSQNFYLEPQKIHIRCVPQ